MRIGFAGVMVRDGGQSLKVDTLSSRLDRALGEMCLSASQRNCTYLLDALKAVSGRLALRLAGTGNAVQEMIAVALAQRHCARAGSDEPAWLSLAEGFLIPLDDVPELFREPGKLVEGGEQRADLLYVSATKKGGLRPPCGRSTGWFAMMQNSPITWRSSGSALSSAPSMAGTSRRGSSTGARRTCGCSGRISCRSRGRPQWMTGKVPMLRPDGACAPCETFRMPRIP